jgi:hemolysin D
MNERTAPPPTPAAPPARQAPPSTLQITGRDREFLPAALEILETPPAPLPVAIMLVICGFVAAALAWSFYGRLDVHAVAPGKIETAGRAKVVQPLDPGKIAAIHVENGQHVKAGDVLFELDTAETEADANTARNSLDTGLAEVARRRYSIETVRAVEDAPESEAGAARTKLDEAITHANERISWNASVPEAYRVRERSVLTADLNQIGDALNDLDKQMAQKEATEMRLKMSIGFQDTLMKTLNDRVNTRQEAIDLRVGTKINLYDAKEELEKSQSQLASDQGQLIETDAALREIETQKTKALSQFVADNENKLLDAARKADEARESLAKASARLTRTKLISPIDGVAQQLSVTTVGQVVTTGQQLVVIAPSGGALQVDALVANLDIGFIKIGQEAAIKVDAFPFTRFGVLHGTVIRIAAEAVPETEAKRAMENAAAAPNAPSQPTSAPGQPESFVFPVTVALDETAMKIGDAEIPLTSGMTTSVEIKTDSRRVIDYLLSPLAKVASESLRER